MDKMPKDPVMLLSFVNMKLRDQYDSFFELCAACGVEAGDVEASLGQIGYRYDKETNQFR